MNILEELYDGNLEPIQSCINETPETLKLSERIRNYETILQKHLSAKDFKTVEKIIDTTYQIQSIELTQCFIYSWRLCAKFIFDTFRED